jgi:kumamolisin
VPEKNSTSKVVLEGSVPKPFGEAGGSVPADGIINVSVILKPLNPVPTPSTGGVPMSRETFAARHGADPAIIEKLRQFATEHHLSVVHVSPERRTVKLEGTVADLTNAFDVTLVKCTHEGHEYRCRTGGIVVPSDLADSIQAVLGFDNRPQVRPHYRVSSNRPAAVPSDVPPSSFSPVQVAQLYNFPKGIDGTGQTIAILEFGGGYEVDVLTDYFNTIDIPMPSVTWVSVDGGQNDPAQPAPPPQKGPANPLTQAPAASVTPNSDDTEVYLDIEIAGAVAPGAKIVLYFAPNTEQDFIEALTTAIHDTTNMPSVISISWGAAEVDWTSQTLTAFNAAAAAAAALGVTVCAAAGDSGSSDDVADGVPHLDFPASSPFVLACGGTTLNAADGNITSETVWNNDYGATGGGYSFQFSLPAYQSAAGVAPPAGGGRGVPDVSGNADPDTGYAVAGTVAGGTSAVAPLWSGLIALLNQALVNPVGFLHPLLYATPASARAFRDITVGSNGAFSAGPGWDPTTGLGSPSGLNLLQYLLSNNSSITPRWEWTYQGMPPAATIAQNVGVLTVMDSPGSAQRPYVFVTGSDGNLWLNWWDYTKWVWSSLGTPPSVGIGEAVGVLTVMDSPGSAQRPYVFVRGSDGNLWVNWWDYTTWVWSSLGTPPSVGIGNEIGVLTVMDSPSSAQRPYVFVRGSDGNLWLNWWDYTTWVWSSLGTPPSVGIGEAVGVLTVMDSPGSAQRPYVFVIGSDGNLWVNWWDYSTWVWSSLGTPPSVGIGNEIGVLTVMDSPSSAQRPYVFVRGNDGNLWVNWWDYTAWVWSSLGTPPSVRLGNQVGVLTVMDSPSSAQRPYVFVRGSDGNVWGNGWDLTAWIWSSLGTPPSTGIGGEVGVLTVMDNPGAAQRPYVFVTGSDGNLWVDLWWIKSPNAFTIVPDVLTNDTGDSPAQAFNLMTAAGLVPTFTGPNVKTSWVSGQSLQPERVVATNTPVTLTLSTAPQN